MDLRNKVSSFDMIGWTDPDKPNVNKTKSWLQSLKHDEYIYPEDTFDPKKPPACIFVPEPALMNRMIETTAKNTNELAWLYAKFGDMEQPKPQWLIEQEELKFRHL